mmetsp:Transcript_87659/g.145649  ORF Transcript_87659/g.145649 Transcript_87659/m.145649 type:complete len:425 (-) Transcript_87659:666-1940(-)
MLLAASDDGARLLVVLQAACPARGVRYRPGHVECVHILLRLQHTIQFAVGVVGGHDALHEIRSVPLRLFSAHVPHAVQPIPQVVVVQRVTPKLQPLGPYPLENRGQQIGHKRRRPSRGPFSKKCRVIGLERLQHEGLPVPGVDGWHDLQAVANEVEHLAATGVTDGDVLRVFGHGRLEIRNSHVPDNDIRQTIGVIKAGPAGLSDDPVRQIIRRQREIWDNLIIIFDGGAREMFDMHTVVLHELIPDDRVRGLGSHIQKLLEAVPRAVVRAVGTDDVQLLESQVLLDRAHRLHLASDANEKQLLHIGQRFQMCQHGEVGAVGGLNPFGRNNVLHRAGHDGLWGEPVLRIALHTDHGIHSPGLEHLDRHLCDDPRPLRCALCGRVPVGLGGDIPRRLRIPGVQHLFGDARVCLVLSPAPAVHLLF